MSKDEDTLADGKEAFELAATNESDNRAEALDDLNFARLNEQWDEKTKADRERQGLPCLTNNKLPAFIRQVTNDGRQNKPSIKVHPADSVADPATAEILNGLIRNIEATSRAAIAYDTAFDFAVSMGYGYFRINTRFATDDTFDLDLVIEQIANPFSVYGDPYSTGADSADWNSAFITELLSKAQFEAQYKEAEKVDWDAAGYEGLVKPWREDEQILVAQWWQREKVKKTALLLSDQRVVMAEVLKQHPEQYARLSVVTERKIDSHKVTHITMSGAEVLDRKDWGGKYIPIVPVYGEEVNVEGKRHFRSLIRDAKDPQRMHNYWRTKSTELVALAPKAPYIGPKGAFKTDKDKWETANTENHAYIEYDGNEKPERQPFAGIPAGALQEALNASDDIKAIIGIYDASLGARSNETSGRAIMARQREGDVSTFHFVDNLARAIEHAGRILIDLIPKVYTVDRVIRVLGPQQEVTTVPLGKSVEVPGEKGQPPTTRIYDLAAGKYDLTVTTGPSFTTRREEAATQMMEFIQAVPAAAPVIGDLIAKNLDWPGADEIGKRLHSMLPPEMRGEAGGLPPEVQEAAQMAQQQMQEMGQALQQAQQQLQQLQSDHALEEKKLALEDRKISVDEYKAQTERIQAQNEARNAAIGGSPTSVMQN